MEAPKNMRLMTAVKGGEGRRLNLWVSWKPSG